MPWEEVAVRQEQETPVDEKTESRRVLFRRLGWGSITLFVCGSTTAMVRFFFPRTLLEAPARFKAGMPSDYAAGSVSAAFKDKYRVWIVRREDGQFLSLSAQCTHLGCTPTWKESEGIIHCPCHGSKFDADGTNFAGPAPRPLDRFKVALGPDGELVVDRSVRYIGIGGQNSDELYPQSLLKA
jgi:cytochrome b6-f complex iron-sulfur subunit